MSRKEWILVALTAILLAVYAVYFTDWFKKPVLHISHTARPTRAAQRLSGQTGVLLAFGFDHPVRLKELAVVPLVQWQTNHSVPPLWHLISDSNSAPLTAFVYGAHIRGMKPAMFASKMAQPLATNTVYRLIVTAGKITGEHDFQIGLPGMPAAAK